LSLSKRLDADAHRQIRERSRGANASEPTGERSVQHRRAGKQFLSYVVKGPYYKPTQVGELRMRRRTEEFALRNSANCIRNFGISMAARAAAEKWPMRLFTKNTGLCEPAMGSIWTDTCPVLEG
jgi:hypothetical protein